MIKKLPLKLMVLSLFLLSHNVWAGTSIDYNDANCSAAWLMDVDEDPITDDSGENNTGALKGAGEPNHATASPPDTFSTGYYTWDGTNDYIEVTDDATLSPGTSNFAIVTWIRTSVDYNARAEAGTPYGDYGSTGNNLVLVEIASADNKLNCKYRDNEGDDLVVSGQGSAVNDGAWHHIAWVRETQTTAKLYFAGSSIGTDSDGSMGAVNTSDAHDVRLGQLPNFNVNDYGGDLDETAVFKRSIDSTEVNDIMDNGLAPAAAAAFIPKVWMF